MSDYEHPDALCFFYSFYCFKRIHSKLILQFGSVKMSWEFEKNVFFSRRVEDHRCFRRNNMKKKKKKIQKGKKKHEKKKKNNFFCLTFFSFMKKEGNFQVIRSDAPIRSNIDFLLTFKTELNCETNERVGLFQFELVQIKSGHIKRN